VVNRWRTNVLKVIIIFISFFFLFWPLKIRAEELPVQSPSVIFNEVAWAGSSFDWRDEWIELKNMTDQKINLDGWQITYWDGDEEKIMITFSAEASISAESLTERFYLISKYDLDKSILNIEPASVASKITLSNEHLQLKLYDGDFTDGRKPIDVANDQEEPFAGRNTQTKASMERISQVTDGSQPSAWYTAFNSVNLDSTGKDFGTPGAENSYFIFNSDTSIFQNFSSFLNLENAFTISTKIESVIDGDTIHIENILGLPTTTVRLLGIDCPEKGQYFYNQAKQFWDGLIGQPITLIVKEPILDGMINPRLLAIVVYQDQILNLELLEQGLAWRSLSHPLLIEEYWDQIFQNSRQSKYGLWASYGGNALRINELYPNPPGNESILKNEWNEWIELYNNSDQEIDVSFYKLDKKTYYSIPEGTKLAPRGYFILSQKETSISLANKSDCTELYVPSGELVDQTCWKNAPEGQSWARGENGNFYWTTNLTPGASNQIVAKAKKEKITKEETKKEETAAEPINENKGGEVTQPQTIITKKVIIVTTTIPPPQTNLVPISPIILGAQTSRPLPSFQNWLFIILLIFTGAFLYLTGDFVWQKYLLPIHSKKPKIWPPT